MINGLEIDNEGNKFWWKNDKLHRKDGPAIEWSSGTKSWHINGKRHRDDGPAIECFDGEKRWWLYGEFYGNEKPDNWNELIKISRAKRLCEL
jgi:hypothetical protein